MFCCSALDVGLWGKLNKIHIHFKGEVKLPSQNAMWRDIRGKQQNMAERYVKTQRHTIQVDYLPYMDELAEKVGCRPDLSE